jgi:hypothetical protein
MRFELAELHLHNAPDAPNAGRRSVYTSDPGSLPVSVIPPLRELFLSVYQSPFRKLRRVQLTGARYPSVPSILQLSHR